jgi:hypothetical protein
MPTGNAGEIVALDNAGHSHPLELGLSALQIHHGLGRPASARLDARHALTALDVLASYAHQDHQRYDHPVPF